jgi:protein subunit release factor A
MITMEVHPGEGGADAQTFAGELASAVSKFTGSPATFEGGRYTLHRL